MRLLVVDDERITLRNMMRILKRLYSEAEIVGADDYGTALAHKDEHFDVAFLDIELPSGNGVDLAGRLLESNPRLNVIFVTAYGQYALEALHLHVSGYLMKPYVADDVREEMEHLRYPIEELQEKSEANQKPRVYVRCFGHFEVFVNDEPIHFERRASKEVLAFLVNLRGASASRIDISEALWEDSVEIDRKKAYFHSLIASLRNTLKEYNMEDVLISHRDSFAINAQAFDYDYYRYLNGDTDPSVQFRGEYMMQYTWSEETTARLSEWGI